MKYLKYQYFLKCLIYLNYNNYTYFLNIYCLNVIIEIYVDIIPKIELIIIINIPPI